MENEKTIKQYFLKPLKYLLETKLNMSVAESGIQADCILKNNEVKKIIDMI